MPRKGRIKYAGAKYHIIGRGNERRDIYKDNWDYEKFLSKFIDLNDRFSVKLHAYCLMPNHFHLLLETQQENISIYMKKLLGWYATYFNRRHNRVGHLFQGRFKSYVIEDSLYFLETSRYIHLNPCKAGIKEKPEEYKWSSMRCYLDTCNKMNIETVKTLSFFKSRKHYYRFVIEKLGDVSTYDLDVSPSVI